MQYSSVAANAEAIEDIRAKAFDKYEERREGLTLDEALEAAVLGYRVTSDRLAAGSFLTYNFNGWRHEFKCGSSYSYTPLPEHFNDRTWRIVLLPSEVVLDAWGKPKRNAWGQPIQ